MHTQDTVESDDGDEVDTIGEEIHITGAKKPTGLFPMSEFLNPVILSNHLHTRPSIQY